MGKIGQRISERQKHVHLSKGKNYCVICGAHEILSEDHVPPKVATPFREIVQYHITEVHGVNVNERVKGVKSTNGSKFRTICRRCNNLIGRHDSALGDLCKAVSLQAHHYFETASQISTNLHLRCDAGSVMHAVVGHMMSATTTKECKQPPIDAPFWQGLREFVLEGTDPSKTHEFYCWFYPFRNSVSAKNVGFHNQGHIAYLTVLAFYPIAFMVTAAGQAIYPAHASSVSLESDSITLNLISKGFQYARFPFHGLEGDQILALRERLCIVSVPTHT